MAPDSTIACPSCGTPAPPDARFCANCGASLAGTSTDAVRHAALSSAAPAPLIDKMRSAKLTGERKPVTALFADVVGSTHILETMDPEDWTVIVNQAFELMSAAVYRYEGTIAQLQGDALLAFFGAPLAHEDDPERAVRAALDMIAATDEFAAQLKVARGIDFRIRAGINSGLVLVGNIGSDLRYEYTALGDAVNVAARMQTAAQPGTVLMTDRTARLVRGTFDVDDLGDIAVKGKSEPVHAYRVIGLRSTPERRRGLAAVGLSSPLVGRAEELARLTSLFEVVSAGRGRLAVIIGEPGLGKSRLLTELRSAVGANLPGSADSGPLWIEGRCATYGRSVPYHLVLDLVRSMLGIPYSADEQETRALLDNALVTLLGDEANDIDAYLSHMLSLPLSGEAAERVQLEPDVLQGRYVASIIRLLRALAGGDGGARPLVMVAEDIHWADPASVEVLLQLMPLLTAMPVLQLFVGRNETDAPGWRLVSQARAVFAEAMTEIRLSPLTDEQSRGLVANLLEIESLPEAVRDVILARAEGNPFFVEEVIRMLIESGAIVRSGDRWLAHATIVNVEIPETLHGLLLARIDQLPEEAKRSLRVASVIGRQFPVRVLERVLAGPTG
jgi:class 3 adenylate cyclase